MNMTNIKAVIFGLIVVGSLAMALVQYRSEIRLRQGNQSLLQQIAQLKTDDQTLSDRLAGAKDARSLTEDQLNELLRLRGEVGGLRRQLGELGKLRGENRQLRDAEAKLEASNEDVAVATISAEFNANEVRVVNTVKQLGLAERIYAEDNNGQYATNFDQMKSELGGLYKSPLLDNIEFVNAGIATEQSPQMLIFRERDPRPSPIGTWQRVYGLADGSVQVAASPDGKFNAWEKYDYNQKGFIFSPPSDPDQ